MRDEVIRRTKSSRKKVVLNIAAKATKNIAMNQSTHRNVLFESSHCFLCDSEGTVERFYADFLVNIRCKDELFCANYSFDKPTF